MSAKSFGRTLREFMGFLTIYILTASSLQSYILDKLYLSSLHT